MSKQLKERVQVGTDSDGKPIYEWATGATKHELQISIAKLLLNFGMLGDGISENKEAKRKLPTMKAFIEKTYIPTFITPLNSTTGETYKQYIKLNIVPFMGQMRMDEVNVTTIQQFYDWMATAGSRGRRKNLNERTIARVGGLVSRIFRVAQEMGMAVDNPVKSALLKIRAEKGTHHKALPDDEVRRIKKAIPLLSNQDERLFMALLVYTGMRPEEVRGFRWDQINFEKQYGLVTQAVTYPTNSQPHIGKPKTERSARTVLLPTPLVEILKPCAKESGYVCGGDQPWCYSRATRTWKSAFKNLGIVGYTNYDFRSTFGTQLKESGVSSAIVADLMGHADTRMVETVYARTRHEGVMKNLILLERLNAL